MSKNLFTPGPFEICQDDFDDSYYIRCKGAERHNGFIVERIIAGRIDSKGDADLFAAAPQLYADLQAAAAQLRKYEVLHTLKKTPDSLEKARVNAELAERFESTLAAARGEA